MPSVGGRLFSSASCGKGQTNPAVQHGGIEIEVGAAPALHWPIQEYLYLQVDLRADAAHVGFVDPAL